MTRKEKDTIDSGYAHLEYNAQFILGAESDLKNALRSEKRERSSLQAAKALLISSFLDGWDNPNFPASDLFHRATGLAFATMLGAAAKVRGHKLDREADMREAVAVHERTQAERLLALREVTP